MPQQLGIRAVYPWKGGATACRPQTGSNLFCFHLNSRLSSARSRPAPTAPRPFTTGPRRVSESRRSRLRLRRLSRESLRSLCLRGLRLRETLRRRRSVRRSCNRDRSRDRDLDGSRSLLLAERGCLQMMCTLLFLAKQVQGNNTYLSTFRAGDRERDRDCIPAFPGGMEAPVTETHYTNHKYGCCNHVQMTTNGDHEMANATT
jgi:hypothetical protein